MSSTPEVTVLSKKHQTKTLSAKKKSLKTIRNVLSSSSATNWPTLEDDDRMKILDEFNKIQINKLKEKIKHKSHNSEVLSLPTLGDIRKSLKFGINEIAKCLKDDDCSGVLVEMKIPHILAAHIVAVAKTKNIPIFCIPGLKDTLESTFGFKSSTVCFKKDCNGKIFSDILNVMRKIKSKNAKVDEEPMKCESTHKTDVKNILQDLKPPIKSEVTYLYRTNKKERIFIPSSSTDSINNANKTTGKTLNYIKLAIDTGSRNIIKTPIYKPLVIKRIKNNVNRSKENQLRSNKNKRAKNK